MVTTSYQAMLISPLTPSNKEVVAGSKANV
jgi:hypothetical protein